jgi:hypothetical protein
MGRVRITEKDQAMVAKIKQQALSLARAHSGVEAAVVAAGLAQAAVLVLEQYPARTRTLLMEGMAAWFQSRDVDLEQQQAEAAAVLDVMLRSSGQGKLQ